MHHRFQALIERRLRAEIEQNPPLFPWENQVLDYDEISDALVPAGVPALWRAQLRDLRLPVAVPEAVLATLLDRCREVAATSAREGKKLVSAVESLFPERGDRLNELAGLVLMGAARGDVLATEDSAPIDYDSATATQQMVLSLIAARELLSKLTLKVSGDRPDDRRQWVTELGVLELNARYDRDREELHVTAVLPCGGALQLRGEGARALASRSDAGAASVTLADISGTGSYALEVRLDDEDGSALTFAIDLA